MESSVMRSRAVIASGRFTCQDQAMVPEGTMGEASRICAHEDKCPYCEPDTSNRCHKRTD